MLSRVRVRFVHRVEALPHAAALAGLFVGVRVWAWGRGLRFDASEAAGFWHFIEPALLRERLAESLWYLHAQPPVFNAWLGAYHKLFGEALPIAFGLTYLALGVALCVQMLHLGRLFGVPPWPRSVGVAVFCMSPAVLLYEHFLLYAYPVAVLLTWSAVRLHRALERGRARDWWVFVAAVTTIVLMRALYHPLWLVSVVILAAWASTRLGGSARALAGPALLALLLVGAVLVKNHALFGRATLSSFAGMNLSRVALDRMAPADRAARIAAGTLSPWAATGGFRPLSAYVPAPRVPVTGVPLLDRPVKEDGSNNFHHRAYVEISAQLARDSLAVIRADPLTYARAVMENLRQTLHPASTYAPLAEARARIQPLVSVHEPLTGWLPFLGPRGIWPVALPLVMLATVAALWRQRATPDARWVVTAYVTGTIAYAIGVGALMERTENQRFRFDVDPLIWLLLLALATRGWLGWRQKCAGRVGKTGVHGARVPEALP
jgi:hypothetical protein